MRLHIRDRNQPVVDALRREFQGLAEVEVTSGDIFDAKADAIVSPANSFGFMDGGIDLAYSKRFGWDLQERLQARLRKEYWGELPVGAALVIENYATDIPWLVSALWPAFRMTCRVPYIDGWYTDDPGQFRFHTRDAAHWTWRGQLAVDVRGWKPWAWWCLAVGLIVTGATRRYPPLIAASFGKGRLHLTRNEASSIRAPSSVLLLVGPGDRSPGPTKQLPT